MNNKEDLEPFFEYLLSNRIKKDLSFTREYPGYNQLIQSYQSKWNSVQLKANTNKLVFDNQIYDLPYDLFNKGSFLLQFNISELKQSTKKYLETKKLAVNPDYRDRYQLHPLHTNDDAAQVKFPSSAISSILKEDFIDKAYAMTCVDKQDPILCVDLTNLTQKKFPLEIVDGNHRAYGKLKSNNDYIDTYVVGRNIWIETLLTNKDKLFVKLFDNINYLISYNAGQRTVQQVKDALYTV